MKSDTTTTQTLITPKKRHYTTRDFYNDFDRKIEGRQRNYFRSLGKHPERKLSFRTYCKIVQKFLSIYFYEAFFLDRPLFFFLGGRIERVRISTHKRREEKQNGKIINQTISVIWYLIPFKNILHFISFDFQKGSTNPIPKIRKEFLSTNDVGLLPLKNIKSNELKDRNLICLEK